MTMKDKLEGTGTSISGISQMGSLIHLWWLSSRQREGLLENQQTSILATIITQLDTTSSMLIHLKRAWMKALNHRSQPFTSPTSCIIRQILIIITISSLPLWTRLATIYAQQLTTLWCNISNTTTTIIINSLWLWLGTTASLNMCRITVAEPRR